MKNLYSSLCAFVHSSLDKLSQTQALITLPQYNSESANEFSILFQKTINSILSILYYNYYELVYKMHTSNREMFLQGLLSSDKAKIYDEKTK